MSSAWAVEDIVGGLRRKMNWKFGNFDKRLMQFLSFSSQSNFYRNRFTRNEVYRKQQSQNIDNKWKFPFLAYELQFI